jgi:hypothetical protein
MRILTVLDAHLHQETAIIEDLGLHQDAVLIRMHRAVTEAGAHHRTVDGLAHLHGTSQKLIHGEVIEPGLLLGVTCLLLDAIEISHLDAIHIEEKGAETDLPDVVVIGTQQIVDTVGGLLLGEIDRPFL